MGFRIAWREHIFRKPRAPVGWHDAEPAQVHWISIDTIIEKKKLSVPAHCFVSEPAGGRHWCFRRLQPTSVAFLLRKTAYTCGGNKPKMKTDTLAASPSLSELWTAKSAPKAMGTGGRRWLLGQCRHWWQRGLSILIRAPAKVKIDGSL
jgi:hypothetical protein